MRVWSASEIIRPILRELVSFEADLRAQQAPKGLDALPETSFHPLIARAFEPEGWGAVREVRYPTARVETPNQTQRDRCDLVLTPSAEMAIYDPVVEQRELARASGTLFESSAEQRELGEGEVDPGDAYWIEIKAVAQHRYVDGVPAPNRKYAGELLAWPRADVVKLASDPLIRHAASLVILFTEELASGEHDLSVAVSEMIEADLPVSVPEIEAFGICDRVGNAWCTLGLIPVRL